MSTRFSCSRCGATIIDHSPRSDGKSECPRCGILQDIPADATKLESTPTIEASIPAGPSSPIVYPGRLADPGSRLVAQIINSVIALAMCALGWIITTKSESASALLFWSPMAGLLIIQAYFLTRQGQSLGKMIMNVRIVRIDSNSNGGFVTNVLLRAIVNDFLCLLPIYGLVDVLFILRSDGRCIHDLLAGTRVVKCYDA